MGDIDGEDVTGVTTMQMDEGLDTGDMLLKTEVPITAEETGESLHDKLSKPEQHLRGDIKSTWKKEPSFLKNRERLLHIMQVC